MADVEGSFELAKLQWRFSRQPAGGVTEDVAVMTFHFLKTSAPTLPWSDTDPATIEDDLTTFWGYYSTHCDTTMVSDQYRWYRDGPAYYELIPEEDPYHYQPKGDNPAFRVTEVDVPGTQTVSMLPPQVAVAVTEKTSRRASWGRFYLPNPTVSDSTTDGRIDPTFLSSLVAALGTMYGTLKAAGTPVVVFSIQKPERPKKGGGMLGPQPARALEITELVIDNTFDIIRRRRWDNPTQRVNAVL